MVVSGLKCLAGQRRGPWKGPHPGLEGGGTRGSASPLAALWPLVPGSAGIRGQIEMRLHLFPLAGEL